ncbi:MAG: TrmH family RNA methyltransferase [Lentisphaerota bacterium]
MTHNHPKITIVLDRLRSAFNTGNIFRLADAVKVHEVIACGYTPYPPHPKLSKTAMGSDEYVKCRHFETSLEAIRNLRNEGCKMILSVETGENSICAWYKNYQFPLAIVLGNEALGVDKETMQGCDGIIGLPMFGNKISINVGNCAAVVLYSIIAKSYNSLKHPEMNLNFHL